MSSFRFITAYHLFFSPGHCWSRTDISGRLRRCPAQHEATGPACQLLARRSASGPELSQESSQLLQEIWPSAWLHSVSEGLEPHPGKQTKRAWKRGVGCVSHKPPSTLSSLTILTTGAKVRIDTLQLLSKHRPFGTYVRLIPSWLRPNSSCQFLRM